MHIEPLDLSASTGSDAKGKDLKTLGKDDFLHLLITQLQHQDPLNPMESTEFTTQLAQFTSLEELGNINDNLAGLKSSQDLMSNNQTVELIGKKVVARGNSINAAGGVSNELWFKPDPGVKDIYINIYDSTGGFVRSLESEIQGAGIQNVEWDGTDQSGNSMLDGTYYFEITGADTNGNSIPVTPLTKGLVTGVSFRDDTVYIAVGDIEIPFKDLMEITQD